MPWAVGQVYRVIKPVDLSSVLPTLDTMQFVAVNQSSTDCRKSPCEVVLPDKFTPEFRGFIDGLGLGGTQGRAILRRLAPRQGMAPHIDEWLPANWRRFQVPLVSHPAITMRWPDESMEIHLAPGWLYEVRVDCAHEVINKADVPRVHLQIDQLNATI